MKAFIRNFLAATALTIGIAFGADPTPRDINVGRFGFMVGLVDSGPVASAPVILMKLSLLGTPQR